MSDIGLTWNAEQGAADVALAGNDLAADAGIETAVLLSLFTVRGQWWGDAFPAVPGDRFGSRLFELAREKQTPDTLARLKEYAREALAWALGDGVIGQVDVSAEAVRTGAWVLSITLHRPKTEAARLRFAINWAAQEVRRID